MSANYSPGPGDWEARKSEEAQSQPVLTENNPPIDPQQPLREYTSPGAWTAPSTPRPVYLAPSPYQPTWPAYPAQPVQPWPPMPAATGQLSPYPGYPGYHAYPAYVGYGAPGYGYVYPGYGYYAWPPVPSRPKRDTYLLVVGIVAFAGSCLTILGGLACLALLGLVSIAPHTNMGDDKYFAAVMLFVAFSAAGIVGGGFCFYHSMRSLFFQKPSRDIWLPRFWIFLLCYLALLGLGYWLHTQGQDVTAPALTGLLVILGAIFPALAILALGIRRLRFPKIGSWPTTWRRLTVALVSGATLSIGLALVLEFVLQLILIGSQGSNILQNLSDPNSSNPDPSFYGVLLIMLAVVAPIVEELVKPLAVVILIGRVRSKAEAFALGLACGIGFNLVETTGYISQGYTDWLSVALGRSGAGLLHGFGAAMMALGWYYLTHKEEGTWQRRTLLALGCGGYAILQHAIWNGSWGLALIPGAIGNFFQYWALSLGPLTINGAELVNIIEVVGILIFFISMAGRLRTRPAPLPERHALQLE